MFSLKVIQTLGGGGGGGGGDKMSTLTHTYAHKPLRKTKGL